MKLKINWDDNIAIIGDLYYRIIDEPTRIPIEIDSLIIIRNSNSNNPRWYKNVNYSAYLDFYLCIDNIDIRLYLAYKNSKKIADEFILQPIAHP